MDHELQRAISGPVSASIKTMNNSSFLVFDDSIVEEDSDEEDLDRYTDVGLREQLFITLSRAIRSTQNTETKITESAIPDSIKNKRGPQRRKLNPSQSSTKSKSRTHDNVPLTLPKESYSKWNDSHTNHHNNDLQYHEQYNKSKTKTKNNKNSHKYEYKHAAFFNHISPIESSPNHKSIIKHKQRNNNKPKMKNNASEPSMINNRKDKTHKKKTHKRQQSNIRHYSPRIMGNDMKLNDDTYILDEYDNDNTYKPIPLPNRNKMFPKRSPKIHSTKSDQDIISTLEQVRKDKSEEILQNLPPTSRTPKASNNTDISSRFNVANNTSIQKQKHSHIHNRTKKQVPKHISSRGMPPPPGSNTINRTGKLSRQNTDYNHINSSNILQKKQKHMKKASSYRDTIPPPPKTPPPHPKSKSARNRHTSHKYNTHQQQPIQLQTPTYSQIPISKSLGNNNNSILGASLQHKPYHKHSYTGSVTGIPTHKHQRNKKPKPNKSPPAPPPKWMANNNAEIKSKSYSKPIGTYSRNRTRSRSKDSIDIGIITSDIDEYNTHKHNPLYPLPMKQDINGTWIPTSKNIPPPPKQYRHTAPPNLIRNHASSVAITRSSPNYKSMDINNISDIDEDIPFKLFDKMKNDTKYNTMGPMMFNMNSNNSNNNNNKTNHATQYSNSSSIEEKEISISSNVSISATTHSHIPHAYSHSLPSNTTVTVMNSRSSHSPQNSNNSDTHFIPPSPQHIFGNINSNKNRKHRPNAPMQVYSTPPMRNKLEKMKVNTLKSHNISPINYETIPSNVREHTPNLISPRGNNTISLNTAVVLDPISDNDSENSIHINNTEISSPLSPLSALGPLQDKENEDDDDDDDDDDGACTISPTRMRSNNMFTIKVSDAASDNEIEIDEKYNNYNNYNNRKKSSIDSDDDIGHSDIPMALPEWLSASEYLLCDPTLDPKRNLKNKLNKNPVKNIRARGATWIGKTTDNKHGLKRYVIPLKSDKNMNKKNGIKKLPTIGLSPSTTTPAFGSLMKDRTDSLADRFKGVQLKDGHIVLNTKETQLETVSVQFQKGMPDFQEIHQKFAHEFTNKIFDGHLKSYQRAFMPISPQHLGLVDFSNIRSRRRAVFGGNKLGPSKGFYDGETVMDISIEKRNIMIGKYIAQFEFQKQKRYKKSFGKETPKRKKKYKYSETYTSTTSSSYSLSIAADVSLSSSHVTHKSTSSILTPSTSYQLYPEHYHYDVVHLDNGKHKNKNKKTWQKLLSFGKKKKKRNRKSTDLIIDDYKSLTLDDPSDVTANRQHKNSGGNISKTKDDMLYGSMPLNGIGFEINGFDYINAMYKTDFEINQITQNISTNKLRRGDLILIMDYEHIDVENENLHSFISKYKIDNFLKRMEEEENKRKDALEIVRQRSAMRLLSKQRSFLKQPSNSNDIINRDNNEELNGYYSPPLKPINRPRGKEMIDINEQLSIQELQDIQILEEWKNKQGAAHCMIVLQNIGNSIEVAHVTSAGGTRSFIKNFDADTIAQTLYLRTKKEAKLKNINDRYNINRDTNTIHENTEYKYNDRQRSNTAQSTKIVEALGRGPPVAYRCVVYRLNTNIVSAKKFANEAANVAENLVKGGRVLGDPAVFAGSMERYIENPEKYFYRFLLSSNASLFRRVVRLHFDEGTSFFNFSSSEFVSLCFQRALVNKKSFDRQLIRLLDFCPHLTPPTLLQKYIHLNIDEHGDWLCLGNVFFSYL